ncbi:MAG: NUDIX hydrolase [Patescibacteria group bacterium]
MSQRLPVSVSAAVFIEDDKGRLLLVQQAAPEKGNKWGPPAGGMEAFEDPLQAAKREIREEIGVEIELINLIGIYVVERGEESLGIGFVFRGRIVNGTITPRPDEIKDYRFFDKEELDELISMRRGELYKPEYNLSGINDWLNGSSYPLEVIKKVNRLLN